MDSFYDEPRRPPVPASINQIPTCQLMSEVSIFVPNENRNLNTSQNRININKQNSYNVWKAQNQHLQTKNKENIPMYNESYCQRNISKISSTKQVRFNSPNNHNKSLDISAGNNVNKCVEPDKLKRNALNRPFEEIYMANIPNRHLDLSLIEPVTNKYSKVSTNAAKEIFNTTETEKIACKSVNKNDRTQDSLIAGTSCRVQTIPKKLEKDLDYQPQKYANIGKTNMTPMPQYKNFSYNDNQFKPTFPSQSNTYSYKSREDKKENDDPTVKELLKVVQQQNEQILILQKQVALLLENQSNQKQIEAPPIQKEPDYPQEYFPNSRNVQPNQKGTVSKFAIDVMTSLEVSIRQQPNYLPRNKCKDNEKLQIEEITESADTKQTDKDITCDNILGDIKAEAMKNSGKNQDTQVSFALNEPLQIMERCPSPEHSIHVDMQDYSSESDEDSAESTDIGWTVYNNVMGQVNNILRNANTDIRNFGTNTDINPNRICDRTLRKVKEATMRHLKNIGVNLPVIDEPDSSHRSDETVNGSEFTPTEISFAVKQLLMKYLPDEQLAKITAKNPVVQKQKYNPSKENLIKRRPEFSFATLQYMKKYNLLTDSAQMEPMKQNKNMEVPKILDVTALKQQPKLL